MDNYFHKWIKLCLRISLSGAFVLLPGNLFLNFTLWVTGSALIPFHTSLYLFAFIICSKPFFSSFYSSERNESWSQKKKLISYFSLKSMYLYICIYYPKEDFRCALFFCFPLLLKITITYCISVYSKNLFLFHSHNVLIT